MKNHSKTCFIQQTTTIFLFTFFCLAVSVAQAQQSVNDLAIRSVQVVQVVLNPRLIVAQKPAALKVTIMNTFMNPVQVPIGVTYNFGNSTHVERGPDGSGVLLNVGANTIYLPGGPADGEPYLYWDDRGVDDAIEVVVDPDNALQEVNRKNNTVTIAKEVMKPIAFRVLFAPVVLGGHADYSVSAEAVERQRKFMLNTYPLASLTFTRRALLRRDDVEFVSMATAYDDFVFDLSTEARLLGYDRIAIVINNESFSYCGVALEMLRAPEDRVPVILRKDCVEESDRANLTAHEIGHTFYLWHPHCDWFNDLQVYSDYKYSVTERAYGVLHNTLMSYKPAPHWNDKDRYQDYPKTWFPTPPIYQSQYTVSGSYQWNLLDQFKEKNSIAVLLIKARLFKAGALEILPWYRMNGIPDLVPGAITPGTNASASAAQAPEDDSRHLQIVMLNSSQEQLAAFPFQVSFRKIVEPDFDGEKMIVETDTAPFLFTVPVIESVARIQIKDGSGNVLGQRQITANAPEVKVLNPNVGEDISAGSDYSICWSGLDQDGDSLKYFLAVSSDGGESWMPVVSETEDTCYLWNTSGLDQGTNYFVKVIATDGINTGEDISDSPFSITAPDSDQDGVKDSLDKCPQSLLAGAIVIGECDTGVQNQLLATGCTMNDLIEECVASSKNPFVLIRCLNQLTREWKSQGIRLRLKEKWAILRCAFKARNK